MHIIGVCIMNINKGQERINKARIMNNGQKAIIKEYRKAIDVDIEFEDGTVVLHKRYDAFLDGRIRNPNKKPDKYNEYKGEVKQMRNGQKAVIKEFRDYYDIDVQFEDGTIVLHKPYSNFKAGLIKNPNISQIELIRLKKINECNTMSNGQKAYIIEYRGSKDIDVEFEDKTIIKHKTYNNFKSGLIRNPNFKQQEMSDEKDEDYIYDL